MLCLNINEFSYKNGLNVLKCESKDVTLHTWKTSM